ncbi:MAG: hypothetical protein ABIF82_10485 [Planctomycetota bacterium]
MSSRRINLLALVAAAIVLAGGSLCDAAQSKLPLGSANTIVAVRVKSIDAALKAATDVVTAFEPKAAPMIDVQATQMLAKLPGIDKGKPFAILILDPQKFDDPVIGMFTLADPKLFREGVKDAPVQVIGNLGVIGEHEAARGEVVEYLKAGGIKAVPIADMTGLAVASVDVGDLTRRYKKQMQAGLQMMKMKVAGKMPGMEVEDEGEKEEEGLDPKNRQMALKAIDYALKLIDQIEKQGGLVELGLTADGNMVTAAFSADAVPGTPFAEFLMKNNRPVNRALAKLLPGNSVSTSMMSFDPVSGGDVAIGIVAIACDIFGLGADETKAVKEVLADAMKNSSGLQAQAEVPVKGGVGGIALQGIKDNDAARSSMQAIVALTGKGEIGDFLKKYGISLAMTVKHREHMGIPIDKVEMAVNLDTLTAALPIPPEARKEMKKGLADTFEMAYGHKDKLVMEIAYGKQLSATTYGLDYAGTMNKQIELMRARGAGSIARVPEYQAALESHPKDMSAFWHVSLFGKGEAIARMMTKQMGPMMGGMDIFPKRSELPVEEQPISGSALIKDNRITIRADIPVKPVQAFVGVIRRKLEEAMKKQMEEIEEVPEAPDAEF